MRRNLLGGKGVLLLVTGRWKFLALATVGEGQELARFSMGSVLF
jgi:hypothetical protein